MKANVQLAALSHGLATGQGLGSLHRDMHRAKVPWLEVHAPEGIQVVILLISLCESHLTFLTQWLYQGKITLTNCLSTQDVYFI